MSGGIVCFFDCYHIYFVLFIIIKLKLWMMALLVIFLFVITFILFLSLSDNWICKWYHGCFIVSTLNSADHKTLLFLALCSLSKTSKLNLCWVIVHIFHSKKSECEFCKSEDFAFLGSDCFKYSFFTSQLYLHKYYKY